MKNDYPRRNGSGLFNILGVGFAIILTIGFLKSKGYELKRTNGYEPTNYAAASYNSDGPVSQPERETNLVLESDRSGDYDGRKYDNPDAYSTQKATRPKSSRTVRTIRNADDWVSEFSAVAVNQAMSRGVPAGLSLAVGLQKMEQGVPIMSWSDYVEKVVDPLAKAKQRAPSRVRSSYFKYSANSNLWAEGLDALGKYSEQSIQQTMREYKLAAYDKQVRRAVISGKSVDEVMEEKVTYVAEEVTYDVRRSKKERPIKEQVAIGGNAADQVREMEEEAYFDELVGREVAREIARKKLNSGKYIGEEDMDALIMETNEETEKVVKNKLTFLGREINKKHPEAEKMLDITDKKNAAAREELYQRKLRENKLDSRSRRKLKD